MKRLYCVRLVKPMQHPSMCNDSLHFGLGGMGVCSDGCSIIVGVWFERRKGHRYFSDPLSWIRFHVVLKRARLKNDHKGIKDLEYLCKNQKIVLPLPLDYSIT